VQHFPFFLLSTLHHSVSENIDQLGEFRWIISVSERQLACGIMRVLPERQQKPVNLARFGWFFSQ